jgi:hypothetical protein
VSSEQKPEYWNHGVMESWNISYGLRVLENKDKGARHKDQRLMEYWNNIKKVTS